MDNRLLEYPFDSKLISRKRKSLKRELLTKEGLIEKKIAILGGSTTSDIKDMLELFLLNYGIKPVFFESEYAQYYSDAVFGNEELDELKPDIVYIHTSNRNILNYPDVTMDASVINDMLEKQYAYFVQIWEKIDEKFHCSIIQNNFEYPFYRILGNLDASDVHGRTNYVNRLNMKFYEYAASHEKFFINDINYLSADYGLKEWADPLYWHMYKYSLCLEAIPTLAYNVANIIKSLLGKNKKALAIDLDNTMWGGIVGDDGVENLMLGQETSMGQVYSEFQTYLKALKNQGILLNIISKNEEDNAMAGLNHPQMILKPEDFIVIKANWDPKSKNLIDMANELTLLPESFVFVDDNPAEREIIKQQVSGAGVPELEAVEHYIYAIDRAGYFETTTFSKDDLKRNEMYKENMERAALQSSFDNYEDYLLSLNMEADIKGFESIYMSRIAQLTNKSNQFNLTTKRYTQEEIEAAAADDKYITLYGKLTDTFGDNGVVSIVIGEIKDNKLDIILWLMSCRVLKRDMEFAMMDELVNQCSQRGIKEIYGYYYPTAKNAMVKDFYLKQGFELVSEDEENNRTFRLDISNGYDKQNNVIKVNGGK